MTIEERFERIEHVTAGLAEERRKDREDYRQLWRDTQRQINDLAVKLDRLADDSRAADKRLEEKIESLAEESRAADRRLEEKIDRLAKESRAADQRLGERIESLVVAIGRALTK